MPPIRVTKPRIRRLFLDMEFGSRSLDSAIGLFTAALDAGDIAPAVEALGARRGEDGVGLAGSLDDLAAVHRIVVGDDPPAAVLRRFALSWSEAAHGAFVARGALDHRTGLATTDYLATRLRDLARSGECAGRRLVIAAGLDEAASRFGAMLRSARVARELAESFPHGETPIGLPRGRVAVIAPEDEAFAANLARARVAIRSLDAAETAVELLELPGIEDTVTEFVTAL